MANDEPTVRTDGEKLKVALETLERLADEDTMQKVAAGAMRYGSAGAFFVSSYVQKFAQETLDRIRGIKEEATKP